MASWGNFLENLLIEEHPTIRQIMFISIPIALSQVGLLDQEVKEGYVEASKEAVLNYIMLDQVTFANHAL